MKQFKQVKQLVQKAEKTQLVKDAEEIITFPIHSAASVQRNILHAERKTMPRVIDHIEGGVEGVFDVFKELPYVAPALGALAVYLLIRK